MAIDTDKEVNGLLRQSLAVLSAILAVLLVVPASLSIWMHRSVFDTETYVRTVEPLASDPAIVEAISDALTSQVMDLIDIDQRIEEVLTDDLKVLSMPLSGAVRDRLRQLLLKLLQSENFRQLWSAANRTAHRTLLELLRDDRDLVEVTIDVVVIAARAIRELGERFPSIGRRLPLSELEFNVPPADLRHRIGESLDIEIPETFGRLTLVKSDELGRLRSRISLLDRILTHVALALFCSLGFAIALSRNRPVMVAGLGGGAALSALVAVFALDNLPASLASQISSPATRIIVVKTTEAFSSSASNYLNLVIFSGSCLALVGLVVIFRNILRRAESSRA